jgi:hypothetical protein
LRLLTSTGEAIRPKLKYGNYAGYAMYRLTPPPLIPACESARRKAEISLVDISSRVHLQESLRESAMFRVYVSHRRRKAVPPSK